jgi:outer membrane protein
MKSVIKVFFTSLVFGFLFLVLSAHAADLGKIGIIDFQQVLEQSVAGKTAQTKINEQGKKMEDELKQKGADIEEAKKNLERESVVMSREAKDQKERDIREMVNQLKALQKTYMENFKEDELKEIRRLQKEVMVLVDKIGKDEGFFLILEKREAGVLYAPQTIDITDKIIQQYNSNYAGKSKS